MMNLDPSQLTLWWCIPFAGILLSLAFMPLIAHKLWHNHYGKIGAVWSSAVVLPMMGIYGLEITTAKLSHVLFHEYIPFILLVGSLYVVAGGIVIKTTLQHSPAVNTIFLAIATILASFIGTAGAAMLFIRPLLHVNKNREHKTHLVIFFIILVCNLGGCLTALGDPPLFLGFLNGVHFFWPTTHLFFPLIITAVPVLALFYFMDSRYKDSTTKQQQYDLKKIISFKGKSNFILLAIILLAVVFSGVFEFKTAIHFLGTHLEIQNIIRDITLVLVTIISLKFSPKVNRKENNFSWAPIMEIVKLFAAIFITVMPVIMILSSGLQGAFAPLVELVSNSDGSPNNHAYFWLTGILSGFLDNAPTYLVFFHMAGGQAEALMSNMSHTLMAISTGAVFMGALSYIGNAPNFMVKSIAEESRIHMPSFFGYMKWSLGILLPVFFLLSLYI